MTVGLLVTRRVGPEVRPGSISKPAGVARGYDAKPDHQAPPCPHRQPQATPLAPHGQQPQVITTGSVSGTTQGHYLWCANLELDRG